MHFGSPKKGLPWATVVGVVADTKLGARDEPAIDQFYVPLRQPAVLFGNEASATLPNPAGGYIALRSALPPEQMTQILRSTIAEIDPLLALQQVQAMNDVISNVEAPRRFNTYLIPPLPWALFCSPLPGSMPWLRFRSRCAHRRSPSAWLSARSARGLLGSSWCRAQSWRSLGCGLGVLGSMAVARLISSFLFDVSATDPIIYIAGHFDHDDIGAVRIRAACQPRCFRRPDRRSALNFGEHHCRFECPGSHTKAGCPTSRSFFARCGIPPMLTVKCVG